MFCKLRGFKNCLLLLTFVFQASAQAWVHLELGAGNYGARSVYTLFRKKSNYALLFKTAKKLSLKNQGPGMMIINDVHPTWAHVAARALSEYIRNEKLDIEVWVLPGDATRIEIPEVDSIYIQNPSYYFLRVLGAPGVIPKLNAHAREGLTINTGYLYKDLYAQAFGPILADTHFRLMVNPLRSYFYPTGEREDSPTRIQFESSRSDLIVDAAAVRRFEGLRLPESSTRSWNPCEWASRAKIMLRLLQ